MVSRTSIFGQQFRRKKSLAPLHHRQRTTYAHCGLLCMLLPAHHSAVVLKTRRRQRAKWNRNPTGQRGVAVQLWVAGTICNRMQLAQTGRWAVLLCLRDTNDSSRDGSMK